MLVLAVMLSSAPDSKALDLIQHSRTLSRSARSAAYLIQLHALRDEVDDLAPLHRTFLRFISDRNSPPQVRALARLFAADVERAQGQLTQAVERIAPLGYLDTFQVVGSFDNEGKTGCDSRNGPEDSTTFQEHYTVKGREIAWHALKGNRWDGYVDLSNSVHSTRSAIAYAATTLEAAGERNALLALGTSGGYRLWVNGKQVSSSNQYHGPKPDQAKVRVALHRGSNQVLLKVCQDHGPLGFYLRREIDSPSGNSSTLTEALEREVKQRPNDPGMLGDYAVVLGYTRAYDESERRAVASAEKAAALQSSDARLQLIAAGLEDDDANLRRHYLEAAAGAEGSPAILEEAQLLLVRDELSQERPQAALALLRPILETVASNPLAQTLRVRIKEALDERPEALSLIEQALVTFPKSPQVVREAARFSRRFDRLNESEERLRWAIGLRFDDLNSRRALASELTDQAKISEAIDEWKALLKLEPTDNVARVHLAELLSANGKLDEAETFYRQALTLAPYDSELAERHGRAMFQSGKREPGLDSFRKALALKPQNPNLREAIRVLEGKAKVEENKIENLSESLREADGIEGEDAVVLVDSSLTDVQSNGLSSQFHQMAVRVYTARGVESWRTFPITYSPNREELHIIRAQVIRPDGSRSESFSENDRHINEPWSGMYYDAKAKIISFPGLSPGDTLELIYQLEDTSRENLLSDYWGQIEYVQSLYPKLHYRYEVTLPEARPIYWNASELPAWLSYRRSSSSSGLVRNQWTAHRIPKLVVEPLMPGWSEVSPLLHVSTYQSWEQVGKYYWGLIKDQLISHEDLRKTVEMLLSSVDRRDERAVINALYAFVVSQTRYVALEFGIHGYKPYPVDRILARRFGDCKDKASLLVAMLKSAGIDSRLVLLRMRHLGTLSAVPASLAAFNHAIVYLPKQQLFLDGTAEFYGSRELPDSDRQANVLIIEPESNRNAGSPFIRTPGSQADDNINRVALQVSLHTDGSAEAEGHSQLSGQYAPTYRRSYQAVTMRKATFEQGWGALFPGLRVQRLDIRNLTHLEDNVEVDFKIGVPRYAQASDHALRFFPFGGGRGYTQTYAPLINRQWDLVLPYPMTSIQRFEYSLPSGFKLSDLADEIDAHQETSFGHFALSHHLEKGRWVFDAVFALTTSRVKPADYSAFRTFLIRVDQAFSRRVSAQ